MVGWHHRLNRQEFEQTPGDGEDREAWCGAAQAGSQSRTGLSDRTTSPRSSAAASRKGNCGPGNLQKALCSEDAGSAAGRRPLVTRHVP